MSKNRQIACIHYKCEGTCDLGKEASFRRHCQICPTYKALPGGKPAQIDMRRKKLDRINRKEKWD